MIVGHLVGEEGRASRPLVTAEYVMLAAMGVSLVGLALSWKWELLGAAVTLGATVIGAIINWRILMFPATLIPITGVLFLLSHWMSRRG
jgi:hypothetical protein